MTKKLTIFVLPKHKIYATNLSFKCQNKCKQSKSRYRNVPVFQIKNWPLDLMYLLKLFLNGETGILFRMVPVVH